MDTQIFRITDPAAQPEDVAAAAAILRSGGLLGIPTETVYGLGANGLDAAAVRRIFEAKGRPQDNPLILHIPEAGWLERYCRQIPLVAYELARRFWPGPLTFVLPRVEDDPSIDLVCAGLNTITVRCPDHPVARALINVAGVPIAAPSANRSQTISPTTAEAVFESLGERVDMILDGGPCEVGVESTILDLTTPKPVLLRAGGVTREQLEEALNEPVYISDGNPDKPTSPGQLLKHYAPSKKFRINVTAPEEDELFIAFGAGYPDALMNLSPSGNLREAAANLFAFMREADKNPHYAKMAMAPIPNEGVGLAINDRIRRASR